MTNFSRLEGVRYLFVWLRCKFTKSNAWIAPLDVRILLAVLALPLAFKLLSLDFSALADLCDQPVLFHFKPTWLDDLFITHRCRLFQSANIRPAQFLAAAALVALVVRPCRIFMVPAVVLTWLLDTGAFQFRAHLYTIDTPLALLTLLIFLPINFRKAAAWDARPSAPAKMAMLTCLGFVATYYVQAGLSKLIFDWSWAAHVKIGNHYPISWLLHSQDMPTWMDAIASRSSSFLLRWPIADALGGWVVLVEQFLWLIVPFSLAARIHAGFFAAAYHMIVLFVTGIAFITWVPIALAVTIPFSSLYRRCWAAPRIEPNLEEKNLATKEIMAPLFMGTAAMICWIAPFYGAIPPFHNYMQFGWAYPTPQVMNPIYRLGYRDSTNGLIEPIPLHYGAFLDFRHTALLDANARALIEHQKNPAVNKQVTVNIFSLLKANRPADANGWLFGRWRSPDHLIGVRYLIPIAEITVFYIIKGTPEPGLLKKPWRANFVICGTIEVPTADRPAATNLLPECVANDGRH